MDDAPSTAPKINEPIVEDDGFNAFPSIEEPIGNAFPGVVDGDFVDFTSSEVEDAPASAGEEDDIGFRAFSSVEGALPAPLLDNHAIPVVINGDFVGFASSGVDDAPSTVQQIDKPNVEDDGFHAFSPVEEPIGNNAIPGTVDGHFVGFAFSEVDDAPASAGEDDDVGFRAFSSVEGALPAPLLDNHVIPAVVNGGFKNFASSEVDDAPSTAQQVDEPIVEDDGFNPFPSIEEPIGNKFPSVVDGDFVGFAFSEVDDAPLAEDDGFRALSSIEEISAPLENLISAIVDRDFVGFASSEVDAPLMAQQIDESIAEDDEFQACPSSEEITAVSSADQDVAVSGPLSLDEDGIESTSGHVSVNTDAPPGGIDVDETRMTSCEISGNELNGVDGSLFEIVISSDVNGPVSSLPIEPTPEPMADVHAIPEATDAEIECVDDFAGFPTFDEAPAEQPSVDFGSTDDDGFGDFEAFPEASYADSIDVVATENDPVILKDDRGGFDDFGDSIKFEGAPDDAGDARIENRDVSAVAESATTIAASVNEEDEFGDFGDFEAFEEAAPAPESASDEHEASAASGIQHADIAISDVDDGDKFGEFGDFPAVVNDFGGDPPPAASGEVASSHDDDGGDEFGDFGDFEAFEETPDIGPLKEDGGESGAHTTPPAEIAAPRQALSIIDQRVRLMFHNVFAIESPIISELKEGGTCTELPFDIPLSKILVSVFFYIPCLAPSRRQTLMTYSRRTLSLKGRAGASKRTRQCPISQKRPRPCQDERILSGSPTVLAPDHTQRR